MARTEVVRKSVSLTFRDLEDLARLRESPAMQEALAAVAAEPIPKAASESALLHAVLVAGLHAIEERTQDAGYAEVGAEYRTMEAERRKAARRRRPAWADEA